MSSCEGWDEPQLPRHESGGTGLHAAKCCDLIWRNERPNYFRHIAPEESLRVPKDRLAIARSPSCRDSFRATLLAWSLSVPPSKSPGATRRK